MQLGSQKCIEMLCQEEHALHDIEDLWNRRLELGESYCTQSSPTGPFLQEYVLTLETRDPTLCQAVNVC